MNGFYPDCYSYEELLKTAEWLKSKTLYRPKIGIICGTGLGDLAHLPEKSDVIPYADIPLFAVSRVQFHKSNLIFGRVKNKDCVFMQGRLHPYEGHSYAKCAMPVRILQLLGVETLFITNAAGGLNPEFKIGDLMILRDHVSIPGLAGNNPLVGEADERFGPAFPAMHRAYDSCLIRLGHQVTKELGLNEFVREGIYAMVSGPCFETPAECRMLRCVGCDAVGCSTAYETTVAVQSGMRVFAISVITNKSVTDYSDVDAVIDVDEILNTCKKRLPSIQRMVVEMIDRISCSKPTEMVI